MRRIILGLRIGLDGYLARRLPFDQPDRAVYPDFRDWRAQEKSFQEWPPSRSRPGDGMSSYVVRTMSTLPLK